MPPLLHAAHGVLFDGSCVRSNVLLALHTLHRDVPGLNEPAEHCGVQLFVRELYVAPLGHV